MQTIKMSLANIKGKLSRAEMKNIMAGSGDEGRCSSSCSGSCTVSSGDPGNCYMPSTGTNAEKCFCVAVY